LRDLKTIFPDIFNDELIVVTLFDVDNPDIFNEDTIVTLLYNDVNPDTFNDDNKKMHSKQLN
jgi:hypothetical protein